MNKLTEIKEKCYKTVHEMSLAGDRGTNVTDFCNWFMTLDKKQQKHASEVYIIFEQYCFGKITLDEAKKLYNEEVKRYGTENDNDTVSEMG